MASVTDYLLMTVSVTAFGKPFELLTADEIAQIAEFSEAELCEFVRIEVAG